MDKGWVKDNDRCGKNYQDGVRFFLEYAFKNRRVTGDNRIRCPCRVCNNIRYHTKNEIFEDLVVNGMMRSYTTWFLHGESSSSTPACSIRRPTASDDQVGDNSNQGLGDDMSGMLRGVFGIPVDCDDDDMDRVAEGATGFASDSSAAQFYKLLEDAKKPLYPDCHKMSLMSFLVRFWNYKCVGGMSDKAFKDMLQLMRDSFPDGCTLPENFTQCKKMLSDLGLSYNKIDACPNDRTLEENLANRPNEVLEDQWAPLVALWSSPAYQAATAKNVENISKQTIKHTGGSKPHIAYAKELKDGQGEFPQRFNLFKVTHTRNKHDPGHEVMEPRAAELYEQMVEIQDRAREPGSGVILSGRHDAVAAVMGPDRKGCVRCLRNTVKPKEFWGEHATTSKYAELQSENDRLRRRIEELETRNAELETTVATLTGYNPLQPPMPTDLNNEGDNGDDFFDAMRQ